MLECLCLCVTSGYKQLAIASQLIATIIKKKTKENSLTKPSYRLHLVNFHVQLYMIYSIVSCRTEKNSALQAVSLQLQLLARQLPQQIILLLTFRYLVRPQSFTKQFSLKILQNSLHFFLTSQLLSQDTSDCFFTSFLGSIFPDLTVDCSQFLSHCLFGLEIISDSMSLNFPWCLRNITRVLGQFPLGQFQRIIATRTTAPPGQLPPDNSPQDNCHLDSPHRQFPPRTIVLLPDN